MTDFRFEDDARLYFESLNRSSKTGQFPTMLHQYWVCAYAGIVFDEMREPEEAAGIVDNFVGSLGDFEHRIRAFVFWRYAIKRGYSPDDADDLMAAFNDFFDNNSPSKLSRLGHNQLDQYAAGGFRKIQQQIPDPTDLASFLLDYRTMLSNP